MSYCSTFLKNGAEIMKDSWLTLFKILIQVVMHIPQFVKVYILHTSASFFCFQSFFFVWITKTKIFVEPFDIYHGHNSNSLMLHSSVWDASIVPYALGCDIIFVLKWVYQERGVHFVNLLYFNDPSLLNKFILVDHIFLLL